MKRGASPRDRKIVVLDDDPTGVQTVHDVSVYTGWDLESIREGFEEKNNMFYILTNSRGLTREETKTVHEEIIARLNTVSEECQKEYLIVSRSDSTLRGHYPLETEILRSGYEKHTGRKVDGEILCPFFMEGKRRTVQNVHYVQEGSRWIPAHQTEFAADKTFGYTAPTLPLYIEEKTKGAYPASGVLCISLEELREKGPEYVAKKLLTVADFGKVVVNAVDYNDLEIFVSALYHAMEMGKVFLFRSAASLVKVLGGIEDRPLLTGEEMGVGKNGNGGLLVAGSHTEKTTRQLEALRQMDGIVFAELDASLVGDASAFEREIARCVRFEEENIKKGKTVCCYTSRGLICADTKDREDELRLSRRISEGVQALAGRLTAVPSFVIAKGGITSSDVGIKALNVRKATVLGQIEPGVPVWLTGEESRFPGIPYVIFPGNVGEEDTLRKALERLQGKADGRLHAESNILSIS